MSQPSIEVPVIALTRSEAAAAVRVSPRTIDGAIASGELVARQRGRNVRIDPDELREWFHSWSAKEPTT